MQMRTHTDIKKIQVLKPSVALMPRGKKGALPLLIVGAIAAIAVLGTLAVQNWRSDDAGTQQLQVAETITLPDGTEQVVYTDAVVTSCGDNKATNADFIVYNPLDQDGTPTYTAVGLKLLKADGSGTLRSYTTDSDGTFASSSLSLNCGESYIAYAPASINTTASAEVSFTADAPNVDREIEVESIDLISIKAYDNNNHGDVHDAGAETNTDYWDLDSASVTFKSTTNNTAHAMGVGGELDWTFKMKVASQKAWGDLQNYIAVDADMSDYAEPSLSFEGVALKEVGKGALDPDDQGYLAAYEYIYELPYDITETASQVRLMVNGKQSINPDVDIVLKPVAESYWVDGTDLKRSIFKSDGTEVLTTARTITLDIS